MIVTCDKCKKDFINVLKHETKVIDGEYITRTYIECPHCKKQWDVFYDNTTTQKLRKRFEKIKKKLNLYRYVGDKKSYDKELQMFLKKKKRMEVENNRLRKIWNKNK